MRLSSKVLIAAGGTGGHLFPAQNMASQLSDCEVLFAGHQLQNSPFFNAAYSYYEIPSSNRSPISMMKGIVRALRLIWLFKPDVVVGFGSFHSFPVLVAAWILRKKIVLFEPNCSFGKVNRLFCRAASKVALHFPSTKRNLAHKAVYVALPSLKKEPKSSAHDARAFYGLEKELFTILVFGGSQGAKFINETFCASARLLRFPFQVLHFTGKDTSGITYDVPAVVKPFETDMAKAYAAADMVVSRAGASTVSELIFYQTPALIIPYPFAYNHQLKNGQFLKDGARLVLQADANPQTLASELTMLKSNLETHKKALRQIAMPQSEALSTIVRKVGEGV